jgi:hypothetical protein
MKQNPQPNGLDELRGDGRMTWSEAEQGWFAAPEEIVHAFSSDGFTECKREVTTSRRDSQRAGGVWQGINTRTGAVASTIWVNHRRWRVSQGRHLRVGLDPHREDGDEA